MTETIYKVDDNELLKKVYSNVKLAHRDIYNTTIAYLSDSQFQYIFDLVVSVGDLKKSYVVVVNNEANIQKLKNFLVSKGVPSSFIFRQYDAAIVYVLRMVITDGVVSGIEPVYLQGHLPDGFTLEYLSTFTPDIHPPFEGVAWVEGDDTFGYQFTNTAFFDSVQASHGTVYDKFMATYPGLDLTRLYGVLDAGVLKFYYYTAYREPTDISNGYYTKAVYDETTDAFIIHEYTGYYNEKKVIG